MRRIHARKVRGAVLAGAVALVVGWLGIAVIPDADSINKWSLGPCNVGSGGGMWRDIPGRGMAMESGLVWAANQDESKEYCTWYAAVRQEHSEDFRELKITAAVNDGSQLWVRLYSSTGVKIAETNAFVPNSAFQTVNVYLPPGHLLGRIEVRLNDNPLTPVASRRSSALIDDIRIWNPGSEAVAWSDDFSEAG